MKKEELISKTMSSLAGIKTAEASPFLETRVFSILESGRQTFFFLLKPAFASFALGALVLLLCLNLWFLSQKNDAASTARSNEVSEIQLEYFSYTNYNY